MIVDTSAWVEYLRRTESPEDSALERAIRQGDSLATPAPVVMELLAGCSNDETSSRIQRLLARFEILEVEGLADFEDAARIQRICRGKGETIRSMIDCLVAAMALRAGRPLLARDRDYDAIARHTALRLADAGETAALPP